MASGNSRERGASLAELCLVLGVVGVLSVAGSSLLDPHATALPTLQQELQGSLDQAFSLARARGTDVEVALGTRGSLDPQVLPVPLPRGVRAGRPAHIPLPDGMSEAPVASSQGASHLSITVTPRRTVTAGAWFFHDGRNALCLRLSGKGHLTTLRYRASERRWRRSH